MGLARAGVVEHPGRVVRHVGERVSRGRGAAEPDASVVEHDRAEPGREGAELAVPEASVMSGAGDEQQDFVVRSVYVVSDRNAG